MCQPPASGPAPQPLASASQVARTREDEVPCDHIDFDGRALAEVPTSSQRELLVRELEVEGGDRLVELGDAAAGAITA